ncbi:hypothetical protein Dda_5189 [Drechslerella dactyloides]|uniref:RapZ C-terminal domain-containing protein n=1 Tax=Drechslerella dactyloides TaxID=74499 RepID=A0AAD6NIM1_DREDA|nr:hypothetical protein Dda_5189 [Drechslerella dactyloides]
MVAVTVVISSSGAHYGPLQPPATLRYDLRKIPNPPKQLRDTLDGRSKKLRNHLTNDEQFMQLLDTIHADILREVGQLQAAPTNDETSATTQHFQQLHGPDYAQLESAGNDAVDKEYSLNVGESAVREAKVEDDRKLTVNCFCHRGRHRSASMVEELARLRWPADVDIEIFHRDIDKSQRNQMVTSSDGPESLRECFETKKIRSVMFVPMIELFCERFKGLRGNNFPPSSHTEPKVPQAPISSKDLVLPTPCASKERTTAPAATGSSVAASSSATAVLALQTTSSPSIPTGHTPAIAQNVEKRVLRGGNLSPLTIWEIY